MTLTLPISRYDARPAPRPHAVRTLPLLGLNVVDASTGPAVSWLLDGTRRRVAFHNAHCANVMARSARASRGRLPTSR